MDSTQDVKNEINLYLKVFGALGVLTVFTVAVAYLNVGIGLAILIAMIIATAKGTLVVGFFMHLLHEKKMIYLISPYMKIIFTTKEGLSKDLFFHPQSLFKKNHCFSLVHGPKVCVSTDGESMSLWGVSMDPWGDPSTRRGTHVPMRNRIEPNRTGPRVTRTELSRIESIRETIQAHYPN